MNFIAKSSVLRGPNDCATWIKENTLASSQTKYKKVKNVLQK